MTQLKQTRESSTSQDAAALYWNDQWRHAMEDAEQRLERFQRLGLDVQECLQQAAMEQMQDGLHTMNRLARILEGSRDQDPFTAMLSAQPALFSCLMEAGRAGSDRTLRLAEELRRCSLTMTGGDESDTGSTTAMPQKSVPPKASPESTVSETRQTG